MSEAHSEKKSDAPPWASRKATASGLARKVLTWSIGLGLIALLFYGLRARPIEVEVGVVQRGPLTVYVVEVGRTRIKKRYVVSAPVAGQMRRVFLQVGDPVTAKETLLTAIEPTLSPLLDPRAQAQAEAHVESAQAAQEKAVQSLEMAKTSSQFAQTNWERTQRLKDAGSLSITDRENAERDALMKHREANADEFALKVASYELEQAKAALMQLTVPSAAGTAIELRAPVSGVVLRVLQESATIVTPGTQILEIGDPTDLEVEAEILSRDAVTIKPGAEVSIEQWGGPQPLKARVWRVEPNAFTKISALGVEEQRVIVRSDLVDAPPEAQRLGDRYRVEVRVAVWHANNVLLVPSGALFRESSEWKTYVFDNGTAKRMTLEAGHSDGRMTEVIKGLEAGAQVLLHPPDTVKENAAVQKRAAE